MRRSVLMWNTSAVMDANSAASTSVRVSFSSCAGGDDDDVPPCFFCSSVFSEDDDGDCA